MRFTDNLGATQHTVKARRNTDDVLQYGATQEQLFGWSSHSAMAGKKAKGRMNPFA